MWWLAVPIGTSLIAILFAFGLARWVLAHDTGTPEMKKVSDAIYTGAQAFLRRQYTTIAVLAVVAAVVIGVLLAALSKGGLFGENAFNVGLRTAIAFAIGAICSGVAGYIGMQVAVQSNIRVASAARRSLGESLMVSLRGGAVSGFLVIALSLLGVTVVYLIFGGLNNPLSDAGDHRRLRLRRQLRRALRAARRRHLYQGGGRRRGPRRQGRGGHPGGRPTQPRRDRGPRGRQRRRLRGAWRGHLRVHRRREHRRDDPGRGGGRRHRRHVAAKADPAWVIFPLVVVGLGILCSLVGLFMVRQSAVAEPAQAGGRDPGEIAMGQLNVGYYTTAVLAVIAITAAAYFLLQPSTDHWWVFAIAGARRRADEHRLRAHHAVLHLRHLSPGARDRRGEQDRPGDDDHLRHRGGLRERRAACAS